MKHEKITQNEQTKPRSDASADTAKDEHRKRSGDTEETPQPPTVFQDWASF